MHKLNVRTVRFCYIKYYPCRSYVPNAEIRSRTKVENMTSNKAKVEVILNKMTMVYDHQIATISYGLTI